MSSNADIHEPFRDAAGLLTQAGAQATCGTDAPEYLRDCLIRTLAKRNVPSRRRVLEAMRKQRKTGVDELEQQIVMARRKYLAEMKRKRMENQAWA